MAHSWLRQWWRQWHNPPAPTPRRPSKTRPRLEALEDRTVPASISGIVWHDFITNGIQDPLEPRVQHAVVELYDSVNGIRGDADDVSLGRRTTDVDGAYSFQDPAAAPSGYHLVFRIPPGFLFTVQDAAIDSVDSDTDGIGCTSVFALGAGQDVAYDAGLIGATPSFGWAVSLATQDFEIGESTGERPAAQLLDANGDRYVLGQYGRGAFVGRSVDFDRGPGIYNLTTPGFGGAMFVAKYTRAGALLWAKSIGDGNSGNTLLGESNLARDSLGNLFVTGSFTETVDFDPGPGQALLTSPEVPAFPTGSVFLDDAFVLKLTGEGDFVWVKQFTGTRDTMGQFVQVDANDNVICTGIWLGTTDVDPGPGVYNLGTHEFQDLGNYIVKLDSAGNFMWARRYEGGRPDQFKLDSQGNMYVVGEFQDPATVNTGPGPGAPPVVHEIVPHPAGPSPFPGDLERDSIDIFILKFDADANLVWARSFGNSGVDRGSGVAIDDAGNVYVSGEFANLHTHTLPGAETVDFDPGPGVFELTTGGTGGDSFLLKLDSGGNFVWARNTSRGRFSGGGTTHNIVFDGAGGLFVDGSIGGLCDMDPGPGAFMLHGGGPTSGSSGFISNFDTDGNFITAWCFEGPSSSFPISTLLDGDGNLHSTGWFQRNFDADLGAGQHILATTHQEFGDTDAYMAQFLLRPAITGTRPGHHVNANRTLSPFAMVTVGSLNDVTELTVTLSDPASGVFTAGSLAASGFVHQGAGVYAHPGGNAAAVSAALRQLVFEPADLLLPVGDTVITTFTISATSGLTAPGIDSTVSVIAHSVGQSPTISGAVAGQAVNDNATIAPFTGISIADVDDPVQNLTVTVSLSGAAQGAFTAASLAASGFTDQGGGSYRFLGTDVQATAAIRQLVFDPTDNQVAPGSTVTTTFTITANDSVADPASDSVTTVVATSINDGPTLEGTLAGQAIDDNATRAPFQAVTIGDVDNPAQSLTVTVSLSDSANGVFTPASLVASGFTHLGGGVYQRTGAAVAVTAAIRSLIFDPTDNQVAPGNTVTTTFTLTVTDGQAAPVSDAATTLVVASVNDVPTIAGAAANQMVDDNATIVPFFTVSIGDVDNPAQSLTVSVTLSASANGALTVASLAAAGFTDQGNGSYQFLGSAAQATAAIRQLVFDPTDNQVAPGASVTTIFTITAGDGLAPPAVNNVTTVIAASINDLPTIAGAIANQAVDDNAVILPFQAVTIGDADGQSLTVTITQSATANGAFTAGSLAAAGFAAQGGGVYQRTGAAAAVTAAIRQLVFDPTNNQVAPGNTVTTTFTIAADDGLAAVSNNITSVVATSVNDGPTITGTLAGQAVNDNATVALFQNVTIGDSDVQNLIVTITLSAGGNGGFTPGSLTASGFNHLGNGVYRRTASAAQATAGLRLLAFDPTDNQVAVGSTVTTTFTITADDGVSSPAMDADTTVVAASVNDAPSIAGTIANQSVNDNAIVLPFESVSIGDVDNPAQTLTVTVGLSGGAGVFTPASLAVSGFSHLGGGVYQRSGDVAQAGAALRQLAFDPADNQVSPGGTVTTTFTIAAHDGITLASDNLTTVVATSINDATTIAGTAPYALNDNAVGLPFAAVTIADPDPGQNLSVTVLLSASGNGSFTMPSLTLAGFSPQGPGAYQRSGTAAQLTTAIRQLVFDPTDNQVAPGSTVATTLTIVINEGLGTPLIGDGNTTVTATSVNDAPTVSGTPASQAVNDNATLAPFQTASIADVDSPAQILTVTVSLSSSANGAFTPASLAASGFSAQGNGVYQRSGTAAQLTTAIRQLIFDPTDNQLSPGAAMNTTLTISVADGLASPVIAGTTVSATSINDAPTAAALSYVCKRTKLKVAPAAGVLAAARDSDPGTILQAVLLTPPRKGTGKVTLNPDGSFIFRPRPIFLRGRTSFVFQIQDNHGAVSAPILVSIKVRRLL